MTRLPACVLLTLVPALVALPMAASADQADDRLQRLEAEVDELRAALAALRSERTAPDDRLAEVEHRIDVLAAELEDLRVGAEAPVADTSVAGLGPAASKVYRTGGGVSVGGYGEWLGQFPDGTREDGSPSDRENTLDALRGVVYLGYKFSDRWLLNTEFEYEHAATSEGGEVSVEFAYLDWLARDEVALRFGLLLLPMGFVNELHEPTTFLSSQRPLTEQRIIPTTWRENGVGLFGSIGTLDYRTYVVNGLDASGFTAGGLRGGRQKGSRAAAEDLAWVGRVDWRPLPGLLLGASAYLGDSGQGMESPDGGTLGVATTILDTHAEWRARGLRTRALWSRAEVGDVAELNQALGLASTASVGEELEGWYLEAGYDLLAAGGSSASLTPFVRWEAVDTQAAVPTGWEGDPANDQRVLTLGLAYQPLPQVVFKLDWQQVETGASSGVDQVNVGLGYIF